MTHDLNTKEGRAELLALCEAATPGPWKRDDHHRQWQGHRMEALVANEELTPVWVSALAPDNIRFIAAARTALPVAINTIEDLLDEIKMLRKGAVRISELKAQIIKERADVVAFLLRRVYNYGDVDVPPDVVRAIGEGKHVGAASEGKEDGSGEVTDG